MGKTIVPNPNFTVRSRTEVQLSAHEAEHALRVWTLDKRSIPQPKSFSDIVVSVQVNDDGILEGATLSYETATGETA